MYNWVPASLKEADLKNYKWISYVLKSVLSKGWKAEVMQIFFAEIKKPRQYPPAGSTRIWTLAEWLLWAIKVILWLKINLAFPGNP